MTSRDDILARIRGNRPQLERPLPFVPLFDDRRPASLFAAYRESLDRMGETFLAPEADHPPAPNDAIALVRAAFAVAEMGSVLLDDEALVENALAYLAQHLIVPADIVLNLHPAYRRLEFRQRHYASFHTGHSATADIEGVLIHGAQGVRTLCVAPIARVTRQKSQ